MAENHKRGLAEAVHNYLKICNCIHEDMPTEDATKAEQPKI